MRVTVRDKESTRDTYIFMHMYAREYACPNKHAGLMLKYMHTYALRFIHSCVHTNKHKHVQIYLIWHAQRTVIIAHTHSWCAPSLGKEFPSPYTNVHILMSFFFCRHIYNHIYKRPLGSHIRHTHMHIHIHIQAHISQIVHTCMHTCAVSIFGGA